MPVIRLETHIKANRQIVFDLARSVDFQSKAVTSSNETAIAGKTSGLLGLNETVTYRGKHLGVSQQLTSRITEFDPPHFFVDEMEKGAFKSMRHEHYFSTTRAGTMMKDVFKFEAPLGILGSVANKLFLKTYMTNFLKGRNRTLREYAESGRWREVLPENEGLYTG